MTSVQLAHVCVEHNRLGNLFTIPSSYIILKQLCTIKYLLPDGPKNLTMNSLSPPSIVTSCLLSILWEGEEGERRERGGGGGGGEEGGVTLQMAHGGVNGHTRYQK